MTDKKALLELAERVERGETGWEIDEAIMEALPDSAPDPAPAIYGSLDAAQALHDAVLPGWSWNVSAGGRVDVCHPNFEDSDTTPSLYGPGFCSANVAAAWVAAILRAKAQESET